MSSRGAEVSPIMNHGWSKGFYFKDPVNGLMLEYCVTTRSFNDDDRLLKHREQPGFEGIEDREELERTARIMDMPVESIPLAEPRERKTD